MQPQPLSPYPKPCEARLGALRLMLTPAGADLFGASQSRLDALEAFRYADAAASLRWNDDTFTRIEAMPAAGRSTP